jgi:hypothetical protein
MTFIVKEHITTLDNYGNVALSETVQTTSGEFYNKMLEHKNQEPVLRAEFERTQYIRDRVLEYPPITEFIDAMYWQSRGDNTKMEAYLSKIDEVKSKYPKAES